MEIIHISLIGIISILTLLFGVRVLFADRKSIINRSFAIFSAITAVWLIIDFATYQQSLTDYQTVLWKIIFLVIILMVFYLAYFINYFPRTYIKFSVLGKTIIFSITFIVAMLSLLPNFIVDYAYMQDYGSNFQQGKYFVIFVLYVSILSIFILIALINKYIRSQGQERQQLKYLLFGLLAFVFLNLSFNLFIPMITNSFVFGRIGSYSSIIFIGFLAYAILKTHLFNLRIILTESAVVIIDIILAVQIFTSHSTMEALLRALFAVFVFYGSYILVRSVRREIQFRQELQVMAEQLARANEHLKELDAMKTEFVSLASHELLTPVSAIEGYLSMLLDEKMAKVEDPKAVKYMDRVYSSAKRLARLVTDMLNVSRIEEGRLLVEKKELDLSKLINEVIEEIKFKAEENKQKIMFGEQPTANSLQHDTERDSEDKKPSAVSRQPSANFMTFGDPDKLKEVVVNLIGNSIKYSKNPGTITVTITRTATSEVAEHWQKVEDEIKARPLDDQEAIKSAVDEHFHALVGQEQLLISVQDQGIGIPKEELPRLFKKFHRVGDYTTAESQGTGLGLYISRALVELHHGRIWADSEGSGKGSTFTFSLPDIAAKDELLKMEAQVPQLKEQLKPLAKPAKQAEEI